MNQVMETRDEPVRDGVPDGVHQAADRFVAMVGRRVREARQRNGIARRVLSERSGVSQRYLAQLEAGTGNISIALLFRVAQALGQNVAWLVSEDGPCRQARRHRRRVCLIGLRGAGKSSLGKLVAGDLGLPFVELNADIEEQSGMPVEEVMALYGQEGYRRLERKALERIVASTGSVVLAVAGGIVSEPASFDYLLEHFHTVWLKAAPEDHMSRVRAQGDERPMAGNPRAMDELKSILTSREALYARAEATVVTSGKSLDDSRNDLLETVRQRCLGRDAASGSQGS